MSAQGQEAKQTINLSIDELDAALRLLSAEQQAAQAGWRKWVLNLIFYSSFAIAIIACPLGLLLVWFDAGLGWGLLIAAVIAIILFILTSRTTLDKAIRKIHQAIEGSELAERAETGWNQQSQRLHLILGCGFIPGILGFLGGVGWLIYGLIAKGEVSLISLALIALPILLLYLVVAIRRYQEFQYFSQVAQLHSQFQSRLQKASAEGLSEISVPPGEVELLGRIETSQAERQVKKAAQELPELAKFYSVTIAPEPLKYLKDLTKQQHEARYAIREITDSLQIEPRPPNAQPILGRANEFAISSENYEIVYQVDDQRQHVEVIDIHEIDRGEVEDVT
jgi:mRNA-degrading endonuclease RelE of RelBE toxin-antitoxin system